MNDQSEVLVKCLLVDDREDNLLVLQGLLRRDGVELLTARSGPEALEILLVHDIALALLDVQMPEMDGFELAELMRGSDRTRHVPIIFITAGSHDQGRVFRGYDSGAVDFLHKPIEAHVLTNKAAVFFQLYRQKRQLALELAGRTEMLRLSELFTAALGHDLRNPLNAIVMSAQTMRIGSAEPLVQEAAARVLTSAQRMSSMIEDMVDLARTRLAGGITVHRVPTDLGPVVDRVVDEQRQTKSAMPLSVTKRGDLAGNWDPERMAQVVSNLIGNAQKHGDPSRPITVEVDGSRSESVVLSVRNGGVIPPELLPHVFEPFRSREHGSSRGGGLGLGLFIVKQVVNAHDGSVEIDSSENTETTIRVRLPR